MKTVFITGIEIAYKLPGRPDFSMRMYVRQQIEEQLATGNTAGSFRADFLTGWWIIKKQQLNTCQGGQTI